MYYSFELLSKRKDKKRLKYFLSSLDKELYLFIILAFFKSWELIYFTGVGISVIPKFRKLEDKIVK